MIPLPSTCTGCPFAPHAKHFTPDKVVEGSRLFIYGQAPGEHEEKGEEIINTIYQGKSKHYETKQVGPQPFIGTTGQMFNRYFLPLLKVKRKDMSFGNALRCRPHGKNTLPPIERKDAKEALAKCKQYLTIPESTEVILTLGQYALYSLTGQKGLTETRTSQSESYKTGWRGYAFSSLNPTMVDKYVDLSPQVRAPGEKVILATMHLAALFQPGNKKYWYATLQDFGKAQRILDGTWPKPLPHILPYPPKVWPKISAFDTEYTFPGNQLIRWSLTDSEYKTYVVEAEHSREVAIPDESTVIFQNEIVDRPHLQRLITLEKVASEDTMLADAVLHSSQPHSLNFGASVHGSFNRHKHLSEHNPRLYAGLDAYTTLEWWAGLIREFRKNIPAWQVYKTLRLPLTPIIAEAKAVGILVDRERVALIQNLFEREKNFIQAEARRITGEEDFNIGSAQQMGRFLLGE